MPPLPYNPAHEPPPVPGQVARRCPDRALRQPVPLPRPVRPLDEPDDEDEAAVPTALPRLLEVLLLSLAVIAGGAELVVLGAVEIAGRVGLSN